MLKTKLRNPTESPPILAGQATRTQALEPQIVWRRDRQISRSLRNRPSTATFWSRAFDRLQGLSSWWSYAILAGLWMSTYGYAFGLVDHAIHLPFLLRTEDPNFLRGDLLTDSLASHPSLFWSLQALVIPAISPETLYLVLHFVSLMLMFAGTASLAGALYPGERGRWAARIAPLLVFGGRTTFAMIPAFDYVMINRTVSLGPLLFALALAAKRRYTAAFLLVGATFIIHPTTAAHAAILVWMAALVDREKRRMIVLGPLLFLAAASPLLMLMLRQGNHGGVPFPAPETWEGIVRLSFPFHHFILNYGFWQWMLLAPPALMLLIGLRHERPRALIAYLVGVIGTCLAGFVAIEILRLPAALHLHVYETTRFLTYLAAVAGAAWLAGVWNRSPLDRGLALTATGAYALGEVLAFPRVEPMSFLFMPLILVSLIWSLGRGTKLAAPPSIPPRWAAVAGASLIFCFVLACGIHNPIIRTLDDSWRFPSACAEHPDVDRLAPVVEDRDVCGGPLMQWSKVHLPEDAQVVTPPYFFHPLAGFRYGAERSVLTTWKDGSEAAFSLDFAEAWWERLGAVTGGTVRLMSRDQKIEFADWMDHIEEGLEGYREADRARFLKLAKTYGSTHAVVEAGAQQPDLPLLYEDAGFRLYRIE